MTTTKTHISLSGKRVPCNASTRSCPRSGHQTVTTGSLSEQGFQAAAERAVSKTHPGSKFARMSVEDQEAFLKKSHDEENVRMLVSIVNETRDSKTLRNLAETDNVDVLTAIAKNRYTEAHTLRLVSRNTKDPKVRKILVDNTKTPVGTYNHLKSIGY